MITKEVEYRLVKAMVRELCEMPSLPKTLEAGFIQHMREMNQGLTEWGNLAEKKVTDAEMRAALKQARECMAGEVEKGKDEK
jgi:hypothetical protein